MAAGPGEQGGGHGYLRASDADRERAIDTIKTAFVQGRLTRDELVLRAGQALASRTFADLAAITAGLTDPPRPPSPSRPREAGAPARRPVSRKLVAWGTCAVVSPALWAAFLTYYGGFLVLFLFAFIGLSATARP